MTSVERWRAVVGYEGLYEVSDHGQVHSLDRIAVQRNGRRRRHRGQTLTPTANGYGYMIVTLCRDGVRQIRPVHDLVLRAFAGPPPPGHQACHGPLGQADNGVANLRWGTRKENAADSIHRDGTNRERRKTHCPLGHELVAPNLRASDARRGHRACLACHRARERQRRAVVAGRSLDLRTVADEIYAVLMPAA